MHPMLLSLGIIAAGGILPLLTYRHFTLTRYLHASFTIVGCLLGLYQALAFSGFLSDISWRWLHCCPLAFSFDSLTRFFLVPIFLISPLAVLYSIDYFTNSQQSLRTAASLFFTNILVISMVLVTAADNILSFALAWEALSLSSFFLVMYDYEKATTRNAGYLYFLFTQSGALCIFASFGVIFATTGSFDFQGANTLPETLKIVVFLLAFIGFGSKAGVFPLHFWLPHAHPAAPSHISAIMSGVMIKMGIYGILRLYFLLAPDSLLIGETVLIFGMLSGVLGVLYALGKHDMKRLLAYHSVENIGIILIGLGLGMIGISLGDPLVTLFALAGGLLHVLNHALFKSVLFLGAGVVRKQCGHGQIDRLGGLLKSMPVTGRTFLVGSAAISGLPPLNGFISEFLIYYAAFHALQHSHTLFFLATLAILSLALIGGLASFCFTKVVGVVFLGESRSGDKIAGEGGKWMALPMILLAGGCLLIGLFPASFIELARLSLADCLTFAPEVTRQLSAMADNLAFGCRLFLLAVLFFLCLRMVIYRNKPVDTGPTWGCGFTGGTARIQYTGTSYARTVVGFFRPFVLIRETQVRLKSIFPERTNYTNHVTDIAEEAVKRSLAQPLLLVLGKLRWIQHGNIQLYIGYIVLTILVVLLTLLL
jgi:hydrogenase-4 component B